MKQLINLCNAIYWSIYKLFPRGKQAYILKQGLAGFKQSKIEANKTKLNIIQSANKTLKQNKILLFFKGKSIVKPKKSNFQVIHNAKKVHAEDLEKAKLKINQKGKFVNA